MGDNKPLINGSVRSKYNLLSLTIWPGYMDLHKTQGAYSQVQGQR